MSSPQQKKVARPQESQSGWASVAWYSILALAALLPLATSIVRGQTAASWTLTDDPYHVPKLVLLAVLATIATVGWLASVFIDARPVRGGRAFVALGLFAALVCVSTAFGYEPLSSLFGVSGLATGAITWLLCAWLAALVGQFLVEARAVRELSWAFAGGMSAMALVVVLQALGFDLLGTPQGALPSWMITQGAGTTGNPDFTGVTLIVPAIVALGLAARSRATRVERVAALACAFLMALATFITLVRGAMLGLVIAVGFWLVIRIVASPEARKRVWIDAVVIGGAGLTSVLISTVGDVLKRFSSEPGGAGGINALTSGRFALWMDALRVAARHPLFGTGADQLGLGAYQVQRAPMIVGVQRFVLQDPHNLPLLVAGLFGIPALIACCVLLFFVARDAWSMLRPKTARPTDTAIYAGWAAGCVGLLAASVASVWTITAIFVLFLTLSVLMAPSLVALQRQPVYRAAAVVLAILLLVPALFGSVRSFQASRESNLGRAGDTANHLQRATELAPWDANYRITYRWQQVVSNLAVLRSTDGTAAASLADQLDTGLVQDLKRFPHELLFYRLRADLYSLSKGYPGYRPQRLIAVLDEALNAFPNDSEFIVRRQQAEADRESQ